MLNFYLFYKGLSKLLNKFCLLFLALFFVISVSAQECGVVYVTPNGASSGAAGTKTNPASIVYGLTLANPANKRLWLATGTYTISNAINIPSGVELDGGYDANWQKSNGAASIIFRDNTNAESNPARLVAVYCNNATNFRLQDLTIRVTNAFGNGISTYGVYMSGCSNYKIVRCKVIAGNAGAGNNGTAGAVGTNGAMGTPGEDGDNDGGCCRLGGAGASGSFPGSYGGGQGGDGGERGEYYEWSLDGEAYPGYPGQNGQGLGGGFGGQGGLEIFVTIISIVCDRTQVNDGTVGADGEQGVQGSYGVLGDDAFSGGFYVPGNGTNGDAGTHGYGGGGGGGGGSQGGLFYETIFNLIPNTNGAGAGGGGGGEGGQGATGGTGGSGGGGSFAVYINNNGAGGIIQDCSFQAGQGGLGGLGGQGGTGGLGGPGGAGGGFTNCDVGAGGNGGDGGNGGNGGAGGKGSDGVSYTLYQSPGGTAVIEMNVNSLLQPVVRVRYSGCTNAPVDFSTNATGTAQWYFGAGSSPTNFIGLSAQCSYSTQGRKTFTMVSNGIAYTYSGFLDIFRNGPTSLPNINSNSDSICEGGTGSFSSSIIADSYSWEIINDSGQSATISGAGFQSFSNVPFDTAGNYTLILNTYTNCCGISFPDTFNVVVDSIVLPTISIQSSAQDSANTICDQTNVTFIASSEYVGNSPTYQWQVNGSNAPGSINSPAYTTATLANGDVVSCIVTSSLACAVGEKDTSNTISVTVIDIPQVTCAADSFVTDDPTYFNAQVTSGGLPPYTFDWDFGDYTQGIGDTVAHIYIEDGTYMVNVEVTDANGCASNCSTVVSTSSNLNAMFTASKFSGCSPFTVQFLNFSTNAVTYFWQFGDGTTSAAFEPVHTYYTPGTYDVTLRAFGGNGNDSMDVNSQIVVFPDPVANFQCTPSNVTAIGDTVFFADNSSSAISWDWQFGDGAISTEQNPYHIYANNGSYDVTLVVSNVYGCKDTLTIPGFVYMNVGINENQGINDFTLLNVYPVPFSNDLNIEFYIPVTGRLEISLEDVRGRIIEIIYSGEVKNGVHRLNKSFGTIESGIYLLRINYADNTLWHKLVANKK